MIAQWIRALTVLEDTGSVPSTQAGQFTTTCNSSGLRPLVASLGIAVGGAHKPIIHVRIKVFKIVNKRGQEKLVMGVCGVFSDIKAYSVRSPVAG